MRLEEEILNEKISEEVRINALAKELNIDPSTIKKADYGDNLFVVDGGESYYVVDYNEAYALAEQSIKDVFDDLGLESFTPSFQDWIIYNAIDKDAFDEILEEDIQTQLDDGEITEEEAEQQRDQDSIEWFIDAFGKKELSSFIKDHPEYLDMDEITSECISEDGIAHFVAGYDGEELELENDLYAYRVD